MFELIKALEQKLSKATQECFGPETILGNPGAMAKQLQRVKATFERQTSAHPPDDRILNAITAYIQLNSYRDEYHARLIAWGVALSRGQSKPLIESELLFARFLASLREQLNRSSLSPRIWRGLLSSYLSYKGPYSEDAQGQQNWIALRSFLKESFQTIYANKPLRPAWMVALSENQNLLDRNPCARYAKEALEGDYETLRRLKEQILIPEASWFTADMVRAQVEHACSKDDASFKDYIPKLSMLLRDNSLYSDKGLIAILGRYYASSDTSENIELGRLAVDLWGNPKLPLSFKWNQIPSEVKGMVLKWFISKDLRIFFDLFSKDHDADQDKRRLKFWMRYIDHIGDAYFILGNQAATSMEDDYVEMRKRNKGRIARLEQGGSPKNNAFIMLIDRFAIVEFGKAGNACFCFDIDNLPFRLDSPWLRGDSSQLKNEKHSGCRFRLIHVDRSRTNWEDIFESELEDLGITPTAFKTRDARRIHRPAALRKQGEASSTSSTDKSRGLNMEELSNFTARWGLSIVDLRSRGGNLWVKPDKHFTLVNSQLKAWGFRWKEGKGWWKT